MRHGEEVRVVRSDLTRLVRWMPSLKERVEDIPEDCPGWTFMVCQPQPEGMAILSFALAADWPVWTRKQARAARLVCAECDFDLRKRDDEARVSYNISLPGKPSMTRLVCGTCCNHGVDEMRRLADMTAGSLS